MGQSHKVKYQIQILPNFQGIHMCDSVPRSAANNGPGLEGMG